MMFEDKAVRQTLKRRLRQRFLASTNELVRKHKGDCYFMHVRTLRSVGYGFAENVPPASFGGLGLA